MTAEEYAARLSEAAAQAITDTPDGRPWYPGQAVCRALRLPDKAAFRWVRAEHKYRRYEYAPGWRSKHTLYLSRAGVETLIMNKGGLPRARLLEALDAVTPHGR